jgi:hypothetical protein
LKHERDREAQPAHRGEGLFTGVVACVSGRGPFDDAVSAMLAQVLERRGARVRRIVHTAVSRDRITELDLTGVGVIAVSYLDPAASPGQLRHLVKRLRDRAPEASIIVGLWPEGDSASTDATVQRSVGADAYVGSLRDAVDAALTTTRAKGAA